MDLTEVRHLSEVDQREFSRESFTGRVQSRGSGPTGDLLRFIVGLRWGRDTLLHLLLIDISILFCANEVDDVGHLEPKGSPRSGRVSQTTRRTGPRKSLRAVSPRLRVGQRSAGSRGCFRAE